MRRISRVLLAIAVLLGPAATPSRAATIRDLLLLKDSGLTDDILIALIQSDGSVFHLQSADIIDLHTKGLSDRVIVAMLATAKPPVPANQLPPAAPTPTLPQDLASVPDAPPADRARVDVPPPDQIAPDQAPPDVAEAPGVPEAPPAPAPAPAAPQVVQVIVPVPVYVERPRPAPSPPPAPAPVYWGYGGQKRPGSWDVPGTPAPAAPAKPAAPGGGRGGS